MSYKFEIHRCDTCYIVRYDPISDEPQRDAGELPTCGIVRVAENGRHVACNGTVRPFALIDADTYITMLS